MKKTLREFCGESGQSQLLEQWDAQRNLPLTPDLVTYGSKRKVWWRCKQGHTWQASIFTRTGSGTQCPVCTGKIVIAGENDLQSKYPDLTRQWHPTRNEITPQQVLPGSHKAVWWLCERGHAWKAAVKSGVAGSGCPVCANRKILLNENDLATEFPEIAAQWHPEKNGILTPQQVTPCSNRKIWWKCELGHSYQAVIGARTMSGNGCPYCTGRKVLPGFNDLATLQPEIAKQWHPALNGTLTPDQVTVGSHRKVWWQCPEGHVWQAVIYARTGPRKSGCPVCAGRVQRGKSIKYRKIIAKIN